MLVQNNRHYCLPPEDVRARGAAMIEIDLSARGRARADAQGRCDGAGSEEIGCRTLRQTIGPEGFWLS